MTTKLALYRLALGTYIGDNSLTSLEEDIAARYALDGVYKASLLYVLEQGLWKFALRTVNLTTLRQDAAFHRQYRYPLPEDFVRLAGIAPDKRLHMDRSSEEYVEETGFLYSDHNTLFIQYVSNDDDFGLNLEKYPANYEQAVAAWLAYQSCLPVSKDRGDRADLLSLSKAQLAISRRLDAIDEAVKTKPAGRWPRSRSVGGFNGTMRGLR